MWRNQIRALTSEAAFHAGATDALLASVEQKLELRFPPVLRSVLLESNGVEGAHGLGLIWSAERILEANLTMRSHPNFAELYMPFECLLFFADAGNGDQFAFTVLRGEFRKDAVFAWNHEDDSRTWVVFSFERYLEWWLDGTIKL